MLFFVLQGIKTLISALQARGVAVYLISGGFRYSPNWRALCRMRSEMVGFGTGNLSLALLLLVLCALLVGFCCSLL